MIVADFRNIQNEGIKGSTAAWAVPPKILGFLRS